MSKDDVEFAVNETFSDIFQHSSPLPGIFKSNQLFNTDNGVKINLYSQAAHTYPHTGSQMSLPLADAPTTSQNIFSATDAQYTDESYVLELFLFN